MNSTGELKPWKNISITKDFIDKEVLDKKRIGIDII